MNNIIDAEFYDFAVRLGQALNSRQLFIATAESCTGGLLAASITAIPGSSAYFERGFVVYSNVAKQEDLGVRRQTIEKFGAVSEQVAKEMAEGALEHSHAQVSVAITGMAGPTSGSTSKPVGMVCFAFICPGLPIKSVTMHFAGDRKTIREQAVKFALKTLLDNL